MAYADLMKPELRVSDAERDIIVTELGQHYQDGRLNQGEFDQRVGAALAARTRGDLDALVVDLPRAAAVAAPGGRPAGYRRPPVLAVVPLLIGAAFVASVASGGWHHGGSGGWPYAPFGFLWLIVPALVIAARMRGARRQWR
jgi:uncharacterized protein DUF1707